MRYTQEVAGGRHEIDTTIVARGEQHLRAHRITLDPATRAAIGAVEGPAPLGYPAGVLPAITGDPAAGWELASAEGRAVAIVRLRGYDGQRRAATWHGRHDLNSVYGRYLLPLLTVERLAPAHELICLIHVGRAEIDPGALREEVVEAGWLEDGSFSVAWRDGSRVDVPPV